MKKRTKKFAALILSAAMLLPVMPTTYAAAAEDAGMKVVAQYDMSHKDGYLTDVSGNENHALLSGMTDADFQMEGEDDVLVFSGNGNKYVTLPGGLIESEQFSIEAVFEADRTGASGENSWLYCLGTKVGNWPNVNNYFFLCPAQGNNGNNAIGNIRAGIKDASSEQLLGQSHAITAGTYNTVEMAFDNGDVTLSVNGTEVESISTGYSILDLLAAGASEDASGYIGKSLYSPDPAFRGTLTSFTVKAADAGENPGGGSDEDPIVPGGDDIKGLDLPYNTTDKQVYGNITLPSEVNGAKVTWTTSHPAIVDVEAHANEGYDATPAGVVTRPEKDTDVTVTAEVTVDGEKLSKTFTFTVKAAPEERKAEDYTDYFFAYFAGEGYSDGEQIYFATSKDGLNWKDLNENKPILTSTLGEKGVRDPYIIRSAEGDKFYMIATDLRIYNGNGWGAAQNAGSQSIMVWESTDLLNWSEQRMVPISESINSGCTWAPECYYDDITGEYIVFWASKVKADNYSKQRLYYAKTRDFYSFTEPELYIEDPTQSSIDTTVMYDEATKMYYRYTKNEGGSNNAFGAKTKTVYAEKSETLLGDWTHIPSDSLNSNQWVEGPAIFKFNPDDRENGAYCLLLDNYGAGGYYPVVTEDLATGVFARPDTSYKMPSRARHGTPIPVTAEEYEAVMEKWYVSNEVEENKEAEQIAPKLEYTFEQKDEKDASVIVDDSASGNDGKLFGNAEVVYDEEKQSNVLYLDGRNGSYASLPTGFFDGRNKFTVSMDVKAANVSGNFFTFTFGKDSTKYYFLKTMSNSIKSVITVNSWNAEYGFPGQEVNTAVLNNWINITIVVDGSLSRLYLDGKLIGENKNVATLVTEMGKNLEAYLGKSFYSADNYFKGCFDNFKVYNRVLTEEEIKGEELKTADKEALKAMLEEAAGIDSELYTEESWAVLEEAIAKAEEVDALVTATQEAVDAAVSALSEAMESLELKEKEALPYEDVAEADWFYNAVAYTYYEGLMTGMDPTHFGPYGQLSRAQFALILYRMEGTPEVTADSKFGDVSGSEWYGPAVLWAAENGIVTGYQNGNFGPVDLVTREQMAVMMYRYAKYLGLDVSGAGYIGEFTDAASVSEFAVDGLQWAYGKGIITGKENGTKLDPQGNTARCEAAAIMQRFMENE